MRGSPGNYVHGQIYSVPADYAQWKFWEVVENPPEIKAPEASKEDSVFGDEVFIPPTENTSSVAPTPILTVSTPEPEVTTKQESVVTQTEVSSEVIGVPKTNPIREIIIHESTGDKIVPVLGTIEVEITHDDKPTQEEKNVVMEPLTDNEGGESDMPPELLEELRNMGDEILGDPLPKRRGRKKKVSNNVSS